MTPEVVAPATGAVLGTVAPVDLVAAAADARLAQPLWALLPAAGRARYIRRATVALLDELDALADRLADETGWPRSQLVISELLPAVRALRALADDGPAALGERRLSSRAALLARRRSTLMPAPAGVVGLRGPSASPWLEPAVEAGAALLAGNAVLLAAGAPLAAQRLRAAFLRAGVPGELLVPVGRDGDAAGDGDAAPAGGSSPTGGSSPPGGGGATATGGSSPAGGGASLDAVCDRVVDLARPTRMGTLLVLRGAPRAAVVEAAVWAAFAGSGRHPAAAGRLVATGAAAAGLAEAIAEAAARLNVGDPRDPATDVGPLASLEDLERVEAAVAGAEHVRGGGRVRPAGLAGAFYAPAVLSGAAAFAPPPPGPVLAVVEAPDAEAAVALAATGGRDGVVSIWAGDREQGERIARGLPAATVWMGRHAVAATAPAARLERHVTPRRLETRGLRAPAANRLPTAPAVVDSQAALAEARHGRDARRWPALRRAALALWRR